MGISIKGRERKGTEKRWFGLSHHLQEGQTVPLSPLHPTTLRSVWHIVDNQVSVEEWTTIYIQSYIFCRVDHKLREYWVRIWKTETRKITRTSHTKATVMFVYSVTAERKTVYIHLDRASLRSMPSMHGKAVEKAQSFLKSENWTSWVRFWLENCYPHKHFMISKEHDKISINNAIR